MNSFFSHKSSTKTKKIVFVLSILSLLIVFIGTGSGCSKTEQPSTVILELMPEIESLSQPVVFDETDSQVLRCVSIAENKDTLSIVATKTKSAAIQSLIFVKQADLDNSGLSSTEIAWVNIEGKEGDYDMSRAVYRTVSTSSATSAVTGFGLTYDNWLTGTLSQDELFPCCQ